MMTITVAFGTSTPTSITVVATRTSTWPAENPRITRSFSSGGSRPCKMPSRSPASWPASSVAATSSTASGWRRPRRPPRGEWHPPRPTGVRVVPPGKHAPNRPRRGNPRCQNPAHRRCAGTPRRPAGLRSTSSRSRSQARSRYRRLVRGGHHVGGDRRTPGGQLGQRRGVQVAVDGHGHRPRDRRRRHDQHVRPVVRGLGAQRVALLHAEPVLLVDDHQAQVGELNLLFEQGMGADHDPGVAGERRPDSAARRAGRPATR